MRGRHRALHVALVPLHDERQALRDEPILAQIPEQIVEALQVLEEPPAIGIGDEDDPVHVAQDEPPRRCVVALSGDRVEVKTDAEPAHLPQIDRQEVEEEGALVLGGDRDQAPARLLRQATVNVQEIGGLTAQAGAVVDDLGVNLPGRNVDEHGRSYSLKRPSSSASAAAANPAPTTGSISSPLPAWIFAKRLSRMVSSRVATRLAWKRTSPSVVFLS